MLLALSPGLCPGQTTPSVSPSEPSTAVNKPLPALPLGPDDLLSVNVMGVSALSKPIRVGSDGSVRIPMVSKPIPAAGKLPSALESDIAEALRRDELVREPLVSVTVTEYVSRPITVAGAVKTPTTIQTTTNMTLLEAITHAGGFAEDAGADVIVNGKGAGSTQRISVKALMEHSDGQSNPTLNPGDEIRVPRAARIFVVGNVRKPGSIALVETSQSSVMRAIALSDGLAPFATREAWILRQKPGSSEGSTDRDEIEVHLSAIMNRKSPDVQLDPGDIFYVPDNKAKRLSADIIDKLVSFGSSTTSGMLIWRK